jgi:hypothetical protein
MLVFWSGCRRRSEPLADDFPGINLGSVHERPAPDRLDLLPIPLKRLRDLCRRTCSSRRKEPNYRPCSSF